MQCSAEWNAHWAPDPLHGISQGWAGIRESVMAGWRGPVPPAVAPQQHGPPTEASASTAHSLDVQLRRMLADAVASIEGAAPKADAARQLNAERKQLLARWFSVVAAVKSVGQKICRHDKLGRTLAVCAVWLLNSGLGPTPGRIPSPSQASVFPQGSAAADGRGILQSHAEMSHSLQGVQQRENNTL